MADKHIDEISGTETTGHEWDGIKELNTPLPRWWLFTFYATIIWAVGYMIAYPAIPLVKGATAGLLGYSSRGAVEEQLAEAKAAQAKFVDQIAAKSLDQIQADKPLLNFAIAGGASAFRVNCSQCHGAGAAGGGIYPNLNDDDWLWGGTLEAIHTTIQHGIRYASDEETRVSEMPAFGRDQILSPEEINAAAEYVLKISGQKFDQSEAEKGATIFADNCAACHGENGKGNHELGAPNLTDKIWFYGETKADIVAQITSPRLGVMPAWSGRLSPATIKELTLWVHSRGGGE